MGAGEEPEWCADWLPHAIASLAFRRFEDVGTVLPSSTCHYCGAKALTEDHIVPRHLLPKPMSTLPYWFRSNDVVAACTLCNWAKSHFRSDCECDQCTWAWNTALGCGWVTPETFDELKIVYIVRSPG